MWKALCIQLLILGLGCSHDYQSLLGSGDAGHDRTPSDGGAIGTDGGGRDVGTGGASAGAGGSVSGTGGRNGTGGAAGSTATSTGGATASGGALGTGGTSSSGGAAGSHAGGSGGSGTGGLSGSGGSPGTGGFVPPAGNVVTNGDFSKGDADWVLTAIPASAAVTHEIKAGYNCITLPLAAAASLGWPANGAQAVPLVAGKSYTLIYSAYMPVPPASLQAKVGHITAPYTAAFTFDEVNLSSQPTTFTHTFQANASDTAAGIAFNIASLVSTAGPTDTVCIGNVAFVPVN